MIQLNEYLSNKVTNSSTLDTIDNEFEGTKIDGVKVKEMIMEEFGLDLTSKSSIEYNNKYMQTFSTGLESNPKIVSEKEYCRLFKKHVNDKISMYVNDRPFVGMTILNKYVINDLIYIGFALEDYNFYYTWDKNSKNTIDFVIAQIKQYSK